MGAREQLRVCQSNNQVHKKGKLTLHDSRSKENIRVAERLARDVDERDEDVNLAKNTRRYRHAHAIASRLAVNLDGDRDYIQSFNERDEKFGDLLDVEFRL